jgi:hypothetical protein
MIQKLIYIYIYIYKGLKKNYEETVVGDFLKFLLYIRKEMSY